MGKCGPFRATIQYGEQFELKTLVTEHNARKLSGFTGLKSHRLNSFSADRVTPTHFKSIRVPCPQVGFSGVFSRDLRPAGKMETSRIVIGYGPPEMTGRVIRNGAGTNYQLERLP